MKFDRKFICQQVPYLVTSSPAPDAEGADIHTQVSAHVVVPAIPASIRTAELERPRFIITARALDTESEAEDEVHETDSEAESTEYSTETEEMVASSEDHVSSTAPSVGTTPTTPATEEGREAGDDSGADEHAAMAVDEDDLKVEPSNVQIQVENRSRADHEVIYARLKQPIRPLNEQVRGLEHRHNIRNSNRSFVLIRRSRPSDLYSAGRTRGRSVPANPPLHPPRPSRPLRKV